MEETKLKKERGNETTVLFQALCKETQEVHFLLLDISLHDQSF